MITFTSTDWVLACATVAGPILAVQAQKMVERLTEARRRKLHIYRVLMATRATRLSSEHVQALNMLDVEFYESRFLGMFGYQSAKEKLVVKAWRKYLDSLGENLEGATEETTKRWLERTADEFFKLMEALGVALGYQFDTVQLKKSAYWPRAHGEAEAAQIQIRDSLAKILSGHQSFPMAVKEFPYSQEAIDLQTQVQTALLASLRGEKALKVSVDSIPSEK